MGYREWKGIIPVSQTGVQNFLAEPVNRVSCGQSYFWRSTPHHIKNVKMYPQTILNQVNDFSFQRNLKDYNFHLNRLPNWFVCLQCLFTPNY